VSLQFVFCFSFLLFLLGLFGVLYRGDIVSLLISLQFIIISSMVNFLSFSYFLYQDTTWAVVFIFLGMVPLYLLVFCMVFYSYSSFNNLSSNLGNISIVNNFRLFELSKSDWWGEDDL